jgi:hypothetical protein
VGKGIKYDFAFCAARDAGENEPSIHFKFEILYSCREISVAAQSLL